MRLQSMNRSAGRQTAALNTRPRTGRLALVGTAAVALVGVLACQQYPFVFQENRRSAARGYRIDVGVEEKTDILFVVDNSGSMAEEQAELRANIDAFIRVLTESPNDYQVGLISTDVLRSPPGDGSCEPCCDVDTDEDGLPDFTDCDDGRLYAVDFQDRIFTRPSSEGLTPEELAAETEGLVDRFNATIEVLGIEGTAFEAPLEAMRRALDPEGDVGVRLLNRGFLRDDASLAVVFLTDEDDCSRPREFYETSLNELECYFAEGATPVSDYVDFLIDLKGSVEAVRAAAIVGGVPEETEDDDELGFRAAGCVTATGENAGLPSDECGCFSFRFVADPREVDICSPLNDFFCNYLASEPFSQTCDRSPLDPSEQGGCIALPGSRLVDFVSEIGRRRVAAELNAGVVADSICRADYRQTLEDIATTVVLDRCFNLEEVPPDLEGVRLLRDGEELPQVTDPAAELGWFYDADRNAVCLAGGQTRRVGEVYEISVQLEQRGFDDEDDEDAAPEG